MVQQTEIFETLAQIAIALAGFAGVVVAVDDRARGGGRATQRAQLHNLLHASLGAALLAFVPQLCFAATANELVSWRASHGLFGAYHAFVWTLFARRADLHTVRKRERAVFYSSLPIGLALVVAHGVILLGGWLPAAYPVYFAALLWFLVVAALQFTLLFGRD